MTEERSPRVVGWQECIAFPEWGMRRVKVKVDTGARTSALDVDSYDLRESAETGRVVTFRLAFPHRPPKMVEAPVLRMVVVSNSSGLREWRPLIETTVHLGPVRKRVQFTLTNRSGMRFRVILGRKALEGDFVVDVSRKYLLKA